MRAILDHRSQNEFLSSVSKVMVEEGGFAMAVLARHDSASKELVPIAGYGDENGYLDRIRVFTDQRPEGLGAAGTAFRTGRPCLVNDFLNDPGTAVWWELARTSGWRASAAIPVRKEGVAWGVLGVYATETNFFGEEEVEILEHVATDVGFALESLAREEQRQLAESSLAISRSRLEMALEAGGIGVFERDLLTGRIAWEGETERLLGYEPGGFDGSLEAFLSSVHPDDIVPLNEALERALETHSIYTHEFRVVWAEGSVHWMRSRGEYSYGPAGDATLLRGAVFEITASRLAEEARKKADERFRAALDGMLEGCSLIDFNWRYLYVNETVARDRFQRREDMLGRTIPELFPGFENTQIFARYRECMEERTSQHFEDLFTFSDNVTRWFEWSLSPVPEGIFVLSLDVTERKQAEIALRASEHLLAESQRVARLGSWAIELPGRQLSWSEETYHVWGVSRKTFVPSMESILSLVHADDIARMQEWNRACLSDQNPGDLEIRAVCSGGTSRILKSRGVLVRDEQGHPARMIGTTQDITDNKRSEEERAILQAQLAQARKMESIGRLAGGIAHDFNNMLTVILGYAVMTRQTLPPNARQQKYLNEIQKAGNRSKEITQKLLGFSRQQVIAPVPSNLNDLVADLMEPLARMIGEDIEMTFDPGKSVDKVVVDHSQVNQILLNLVVNSRDAMPYGGKLTIETANVTVSDEYCRTQPDIVPGPYVLLAVSDTGIGMGAQTLSRIFEPFFTTKGPDKGTGLGLATVYGIVKQNRGFVNVYSELEHGTTFRIYIPRMEGDASAPEVSARAGAPGAGGGIILLVEDDELVREMTVHALVSIGYTPLVARSPQEALELCSSHGSQIRLMLTDVVMPGMNGIELRDRVVATHSGIKVLFMSGYTSNVIAKHGVLAAGVHFIEKPFSIDELASRIAATLAADQPR